MEDIVKLWNSWDRASFRKEWLYLTEEDRHIIHDYLQKACYSITDFYYIYNKYSEDDASYLTREDIIYIVATATWLIEASDFVIGNKGKIKKEVRKNFEYENLDKIQQYRKYILALRSFIIAHPLDTNRHEFFGFDGDLTSIDIYTKEPFNPTHKYDNYYHISVTEGFQQKFCEEDIFVSAYSEKLNKNQFFIFIGFSLVDIYDFFKLYIDYFIKFSKYLSKQKRKDYTKGVKDR